MCQTIPVTLTVQKGPQLLLSASSLAFSASPGSSNTPAQIIDVISWGKPIGFRVASSAAWVSASPTTGRTPGQISVTVNPAGLNPGNYSATVSVSSDEPGTSTRTVAIKLAISALPQLTASPTMGEDAPEPAIVVLFSDSRLSYTVQAASSGWLSVNRNTGRVPDLLKFR